MAQIALRECHGTVLRRGTVNDINLVVCAETVRFGEAKVNEKNILRSIDANAVPCKMGKVREAGSRVERKHGDEKSPPL